MLDFVKIRSRTATRKGDPTITLYPEFVVGESSDLMIRGGKFYAVWDEDNRIWTQNPVRVVDIIDAELSARADEYPSDQNIDVRYLHDFSSKKWTEFISYCDSLSDNWVELDRTVTFKSQDVKREDYISKRLPYDLDPSEPSAYLELVTELYDEDELRKIEWAVGSIFAGDSGDIQKFIVLYGASGTGKSTYLNIVMRLLEGYYNVFEAKSLTGTNNSFALEMFRDNPLVSIQHDGDLSKIADNTKLNSIVSHEEMVVNERYKHTYTARFRSFLFMGTNSPVMITEAKSGIVRRLIDVRPSGRTIPIERYQVLIAQIGFELGRIANRCLNVYLSLGFSAYDSYRPLDMMSATNHFLNFVDDNYEWFSSREWITLTEAWTIYKVWSEDADIHYKLSKVRFKEELKNYFREFHQRKDTEEGYQRNVYIGFDMSSFEYKPRSELMSPVAESNMIRMDTSESPLNLYLSDCKAQYAKEDGTPTLKWANVKTMLSDLDTGRLHYVKPPEDHVVIDFDLRDANGDKSLTLNLKAASRWPTTYAEISRSGAGVHLHYKYTGDVSELAREYSDGIEIKRFNGNASLRRQLTLCNGEDVSTLSSGLPIRKGKKMLNFERLANEKAVRTLIQKNLNKEIHPGTKPSIDFIDKILQDAYASGLQYDVTDLRPKILAFGAKSTNHSLYCIKKVNGMKFRSDEPSEGRDWDNDILIFYDVEVFPNLFILCWKKHGVDGCVREVNPSPQDIEKLLKFKLIGFNNRRYDNHILYARMQGYTNEQLYGLSKQIINGGRDGRNSGKNCMFREAYGLSYADIWDFASNKQSLKAWEIELGIHHQELGFDWDEPVPEDKWGLVAEYCENDVVATEAVFDHLKADYRARQMLAAVSGLRVNDPTRRHAEKIIFGSDRSPQSKFVYTDLSEIFPGYVFEKGTSTYRDETVGEGGYVYAEPGAYENVALLDIASMHPTSLIELNLFGDVYTKRFSDLKDARVYIKHGEYDKVRKLFGGKLSPYLGDEKDAADLSYALKIIINSVYGLTKASFDCAFKDPRNVDNIVAKRGALFMINLRDEVQKRGYTVAHIKTDSIKIPNADEDIIEFVKSYGLEYGYIFELEHVYRRMCLVNNAVYVAQLEDGSWSATGAQFQFPYVFKKLFSKEDIAFDDLCITKSVSKADAIYLNFNEDGTDNYRFVGRVGRFTPVLTGGGELVSRFTKEDGSHRWVSLPDTKGYRWKESEIVESLGQTETIDYSYFDKYVDEAISTIETYIGYDEFVQ